MYGMVWCYEYHARILLMILELWRGFAYTDFLSGGIEGGCIVSNSACRRRCCRWVLFDTGYEKGTHVGAAGPSHHHITNPSLGVVGVSRNSLSNRLLTIGEQSWASSKHGKKKHIYVLYDSSACCAAFHHPGSSSTPQCLVAWRVLGDSRSRWMAAHRPPVHTEELLLQLDVSS